MTGGMDEVARQLLAAIAQLDRAVVMTARAQASAEAGLSHYRTALEGSQHPDANAARTGATEAIDKTGKTSRLLSEASSALTRYLNRVAPGSAVSKVADAAMPSGSDLASYSSGRSSLSQKLLGRSSSVKNADDGLQHAKKIADALKDAAGSGNATTHKPTQPVIKASPPPGTSGDAVLMAFTLAMMGIRGTELAANLFKKARLRRNSNKKEKSDG